MSLRNDNRGADLSVASVAPRQTGEVMNGIITKSDPANFLEAVRLDRTSVVSRREPRTGFRGAEVDIGPCGNIAGGVVGLCQTKSKVSTVRMWVMCRR